MTRENLSLKTDITYLRKTSEKGQPPTSPYQKVQLLTHTAYNPSHENESLSFLNYLNNFQKETENLTEETKQILTKTEGIGENIRSENLDPNFSKEEMDFQLSQSPLTGETLIEDTRKKISDFDKEFQKIYSIQSPQK